MHNAQQDPILVVRLHILRCTIGTILLFFMNLPPAYCMDENPVVYLIPGQGADYRSFKNLSIDERFETRYISYFTPDSTMSMCAYAREISAQIDTSQSFIIIGVSLGGMLATEMAEFLDPDQVILISSAKCREELPGRYRFQRILPLYKIVPGKVSKLAARILQPIVEPDSKKEKETAKKMLRDKDPKFLRRTIAMILEWDRMEYSSDIVHIHGDRDHTIPIRNVSYDIRVEDGSHMMVLTNGQQISEIVNELLSDYE